MSAHINGPSRNIKATARRGYAFGDHQRPFGKHAAGRVGKVRDRAAKNRSNARSWKRELVAARRAGKAAASRRRALVELERAS